jgi:DNA-binding MarR family transcriptional regulator
MSKIVDYLIRLGFVRRTPDPADRRQINASDRQKLFAGIAAIVDVFKKQERETHET